ncbi:unnamed protein product [Sphenostylis stenocarpa]|uniref:Uncharacterized protein n=1 Tax=Sphenostylis stenocarpa TaxID=92480 RepID=A0AA86TPF2_9FABA|nr:unnamed protein product [Sphenostylis stenocarpa]
MVMKSELTSVSVADLVEKQTVGSEWCALRWQRHSSISVLITKTTSSELLITLFMVMLTALTFCKLRLNGDDSFEACATMEHSKHLYKLRC